MSLNDLAIISQNITVVYDTLNLPTVDTSKLKRLTEATPTLIDTPEMIVAIYPSLPLIIQFADNRIRMTLQKEITDLDRIGSYAGINLWKVALECHRLAGQANLKAYGFNYDVGARLSNIQARLQEIFMPNVEQVTQALGANQLTIMPRIKFERNHIAYDLIFETLDEQRVVTHLNAHFTEDQFPSQQKLKQFFRDQFNYLVSVLSNLFGEER